MMRPSSRSSARTRSTWPPVYCGGYLNGTAPMVWSGAGVYVADDFFGVRCFGAARLPAAFFATGFFTSAFLAGRLPRWLFIPRTLQQPSKGGQAPRAFACPLIVLWRHEKPLSKTT